MNFEYKVGYLWKSPDEDPGQRKLKQGKFKNSARTECWIRPSGLVKLCLPTLCVKPDILVRSFSTFDVSFTFIQPDSLEIFHFPFSFLFSSSLSITSLPSLSRVRSLLPKWGLRVFHLPDQQTLYWSSAQDVPDCSGPNSEISFWGFCSKTDQILYKLKLPTHLHLLAWWR